MEKGKKLKTDVNDETGLPEVMIQHIQSFLTGKEAARTTILSKSWYNAWLTRPTLDFDQQNFTSGDPKSSKTRFAKFATKSMARYQDLNRNIESLRLRCTRGNEILANKLIVKALKMGATDLNLEMRSITMVLPREVLESETLIRLSLSGRIIDGNVRFSRLKSLSLNRVHFKNEDMLRDIISCCLLIEELSLSHCKISISGNGNVKMIALSASNLYELHKLRRLFLEKVSVDALFFTDFDSRFPCLKDLSVVGCHGYKTIQISSTSLERISLVQVNPLTSEFNVPNLVSFSYSGMAIPSSLSIESSREWEYSYISIRCSRSVLSRSWFLKLNKSLTQFNPSKISLSIRRWYWSRKGEEGDHIQPKPLVLENLTIERSIYLLNTYMLVGLFRLCHPKFITLYWAPRSCDDSFDHIVCKKLMKEMITPNSGIPDQDIFGEFGLKEVTVEIYREILAEWRPLLLNEPIYDSIEWKKIRFHLRFISLSQLYNPKTSPQIASSQPSSYHHSPDSKQPETSKQSARLNQEEEDGASEREEEEQDDDTLSGIVSPDLLSSSSSAEESDEDRLPLSRALLQKFQISPLGSSDMKAGSYISALDVVASLLATHTVASPESAVQQCVRSSLTTTDLNLPAADWPTLAGAHMMDEGPSRALIPPQKAARTFLAQIEASRGFHSRSESPDFRRPASSPHQRRLKRERERGRERKI
ncbi:hypothetical protein C2S53_004256 [Perilla frutescens var. hirtella]|uniref:Uncharacterized protein n=1 Tax=Perilla frutescens var. hirtella TaxID=608512 RepID=A0AAD4INV8_PERFH|nr:hypothetical protein C2S53_004256 [Perilla frutescens var. hirtella]